jgi:hypothetical protein
MKLTDHPRENHSYPYKWKLRKRRQGKENTILA